MARRKINEALDNIARVVETKDDNVEIVGGMDIVMADAYADDVKANKHIQSIKDELDKNAEAVITESPDTGKEVKNEYTAKLTLDEAFNDFDVKSDGRANKVFEEDDEDDYLDYDMYRFMMNLFTTTDDGIRALAPEGMKIQPRSRFRVQGTDHYLSFKGKEDHYFDLKEKQDKYFEAKDSGASKTQLRSLQLTDEEQHFIFEYESAQQDRVPQVAVDRDYLILSHSDVDKFEWVKQVCDAYGFEYKGPIHKRSSASKWAYDFYVKIPSYSPGYPMMVEDYFEDQGLTLEQVMPTTWCLEYRRLQLLDQDAREVDSIVASHITNFATSEEKIKVRDALDALYAALDDARLHYDPKQVKKEFEANIKK